MIWIICPLVPALAYLVWYVWSLSLYLPPDPEGPDDDGEAEPDQPLIPQDDWDQLEAWLATQYLVPAGLR